MVQKAANGYIYLRARYYDPSIGRFLSKDPLPGAVWDPGSQNAYAYAGNNPVTHSDPTGMCVPVCAALLFTPPGMAIMAGVAAMASMVMLKMHAGESIMESVAHPGSRGGPEHQAKIKERIEEIKAEHP